MTVMLLQNAELENSLYLFFIVFAPCSDDFKFFISPTNAHKLYRIVKLLKQLKS
jgi:hypothetical protein